MEQNTFPIRHRPAHGVQIVLTEPTIVWLTVCTKDRKPWLASHEVHEILMATWDNARAWTIGRYVLMPDHLHLFCAPMDLDISLDNWVTYWKSRFARNAKKPEWRWQTGHWDTRLRRHENYSEKWAYSLQNPVRAGLVNRTEDWPYHGVLNELRW